MRAITRVMGILAFLAGMAVALAPPDTLFFERGLGLRLAGVAGGVVLCIMLLALADRDRGLIATGRLSDPQMHHDKAPPLDQFGSGGSVRTTNRS
jgi:hypothetical protein